MDLNPKPASADNPASIVLLAALLAGACMVAVIGTLLPGLIGLSGPPAIIIPLVFYAIAAIDVGIAFWLRARLRKAAQSKSSPVQRQ